MINGLKKIQIKLGGGKNWQLQVVKVLKQGLSLKRRLSWNLNDKKPDIWISREGAFQAGRASNTNAWVEFPGTEKHENTIENEEEHRDKDREIGRGQVMKGPARCGKWFEICSEALLERLTDWIMFFLNISLHFVWKMDWMWGKSRGRRPQWNLKGESWWVSQNILRTLPIILALKCGLSLQNKYVIPLNTFCFECKKGRIASFPQLEPPGVLFSTWRLFWTIQEVFVKLCTCGILFLGSNVTRRHKDQLKLRTF